MGLKIAALTLLLGVLTLSTPLALEVPYQSIALYADSEGFCTAFSINKAKGLWLTSDHCIRGDKKTVNGQQAGVLKVDAETELALLVALGMRRDAIPLAPVAPKIGDEGFTVGYVQGIYPPPVFFGRVSAFEVKFPIRKAPVTVFHEGGGPGGSGAPVLNRRGQVVGVLLGGTQAPSILTHTVSHKRLKKFARMHWED